MSMRSSAACLALLVLFTGTPSQRATARPPGLPLDLTITVKEPDVDREYRGFLTTVWKKAQQTPGMWSFWDDGLADSSDVNERNFDVVQPLLPVADFFNGSALQFPVACPRPVPCPKYYPYRRELTDCLLFGAHPATALLRTRLLLEFDEEDGLPMTVVSGRHIAVGGWLLRAAEAAGCGCFHPLALAQMCWGVAAGGRAEPGTAEESKATSPAFKPLGFISNFGAPSYEPIQVPPVEVEELPVPPTEIEPLLLMPVEVELLPFLPPAIDARAPSPGGFRMLMGMKFQGVPPSQNVDRSGPGVEAQLVQVMVAPKILTSEVEVREVEVIPIPPAPVCRCPWQERQPAPKQAAAFDKADWSNDVRRNLKKVTKARRILARAEHHLLDGRHDQARRCYERVQRLAPGSSHAERAAERLQQLVAKEIIEKVNGLRQKAAEVPEPPPERVHGGIMEEQSEAIPEPKPTQEIGQFVPLGFYLRHPPQYLPPAPPCPALSRELAAMEAAAPRSATGVLETCVPSIPPVEFSVAQILARVLAQEMKKLVTPRLIIEVETSAGTGRQEVSRPERRPDVQSFVIDPPPALTIVGGDAGTCRCEVKQVLGRLLEQVGRGVCIDIDCGGGRTRARGQIQLGGLSVRLEYRGGQLDLEVGVTAGEPDDPHASQIAENERVLRWIESLSAGGEGANRPDRD